MYLNHLLEVIINIIPYERKIEFNNCYFISEVAIVRDKQKGYIFLNFQIFKSK